MKPLELSGVLRYLYLVSSSYIPGRCGNHYDDWMMSCFSGSDLLWRLSHCITPPQVWIMLHQCILWSCLQFILAMRKQTSALQSEFVQSRYCWDWENPSTLCNSKMSSFVRFLKYCINSASIGSQLSLHVSKVATIWKCLLREVPL